jgi:hypothetical protein
METGQMHEGSTGDVGNRDAPLSSYPEPIRIALATFEAFRRLGFVAEDIYFSVRMGSATGLKERGVGIQLQVRGREFAVYAGSLDGNDDEKIAIWKAAARRWSTCAEEERQEVWAESGLGNLGVALILGLAEKGILIPKGTN